MLELHVIGTDDDARGDSGPPAQLFLLARPGAVLLWDAERSPAPAVLDALSREVARGYMGYGLQLADLIQEGNIGLMKAVKRFSPEHEVRLISYAVHWIKAEIHEFVLRNWRIVKVATTKAQRKLFFKLRSNKKRLGWFTAQEVNDVAAELGVSRTTIRDALSRLEIEGTVFSFNRIGAILFGKKRVV
mgnify:CR=1 FL=1